MFFSVSENLGERPIEMYKFKMCFFQKIDTFLGYVLDKTQKSWRHKETQFWKNWDQIFVDVWLKVSTRRIPGPSTGLLGLFWGFSSFRREKPTRTKTRKNKEKTCLYEFSCFCCNISSSHRIFLENIFVEFLLSPIVGGGEVGYAHIEVLVTFLLVKIFGFWVIARYPTMRFWRKLVEILPISLPELSKPSRTSENSRKTKILETKNFRETEKN